MKLRLLIFASILLASAGVVGFVLVNGRSTDQTSTRQVAANAEPVSQTAVATTAVRIQNYTFTPPAITVHKGQTVIWTNDDVTSHTIVFDSGGLTGSSSLGQGASFSMVFDHAGTFAYHSAAYPSARGTVIVTN